MSERFPWEPPEPYEGLREDAAPEVTEYFKKLMEGQIQIELPEENDE